MVHIPPVGRGTIWGIKRPKLNFCPVSAIPTSREFSSVKADGKKHENFYFSTKLPRIFFIKG